MSLEPITRYLLELDALKLVERRTYIDGGRRRENSAEHSWHLAMASWSMARTFGLDLCEETLLKLALVHDLGEIDAGDTFLYDQGRDEAHEEERQGVLRIERLPGNGIENLSALWEAQETGNGPEARFLKVVDRVLPFLHNVASEGKTWRELGICRSQVLAKHAFIAAEFPGVHRWIVDNVEAAVEQGWLGED